MSRIVRSRTGRTFSSAAKAPFSSLMKTSCSLQPADADGIHIGLATHLRRQFRDGAFHQRRLRELDAHAIEALLPRTRRRPGRSSEKRERKSSY